MSPCSVDSITTEAVAPPRSIVEGELLTRGRVFIGRNNTASRLIVDGGKWDSSQGVIRMSQFGNRGPDTVSELIVRNKGIVTAERIELIHDQATLTIESGGIVDVEKLKIGGEDGTARIVIRDGVLRAHELEFGPLDSEVRFATGNAALELAGEWDEARLRNLPGASWDVDGEWVFTPFTGDGETWTRISVK